MKKIMKNIKDKKQKLIDKFKIIGTSLFAIFALATQSVYAASNTETIDGFINFACDWLIKIGGVIALVGGVMFALRMAT